MVESTSALITALSMLVIVSKSASPPTIRASDASEAIIANIV